MLSPKEHLPPKQAGLEWVNASPKTIAETAGLVNSLREIYRGNSEVVASLTMLLTRLNLLQEQWVTTVTPAIEAMLHPYTKSELSGATITRILTSANDERFAIAA
jgi:hypothetical protein